MRLCQTAPMVAAGSENPTNVADVVRETAARRPDATALVHLPVEGERTAITWAALDADIDATAAGLRTDLGLHEGDRVALALANSPAFVTSYFAVLRAGLVAVPLNTGLTAPETARLLGEADAKVVLCDDLTLPVVEEAVAGTHRVLVDPAGLDSVTAVRPARRSRATGRGGEDLAVLMFTSGTSGRPRAAMLSHRALLANLDQCRALDPTPMREDDVVLLVLPLFHIYGLNTGLGMVAATGATGVLAERFDPVQTAAVVRAEGVTNIPGAPPMYVAWAAAEAYDALREVRMLASGASPLPPSVLEQVAHRGRPPGLRGLRAHRDLAGGQQHPRLGQGQGRLDRPAAAGGRGAAGRRGGHRGRCGTTRARSRSAARTCSPATGRTAPAARTPTAGGRPATSRTPTTTATCSSSTAARSWSWSAASTSTRARSRTPSPSTRTSPRSRSSRCPTRTPVRRSRRSWWPGRGPACAPRT